MEKRRKERKKRDKDEKKIRKTRDRSEKEIKKNKIKRKGREKKMGKEIVFPLRKDKGIMKNNKKKI